MLALFLAIALLGTDSAYGRSTIDLIGANHDNTDLGDSELYAKITGNRHQGCTPQPQRGGTHKSYQSSSLSPPSTTPRGPRGSLCIAA